MPINKKTKLYELDPRFFKDYSGDGIGDLKGLSNKVDYFEFLGVDGIILQNTLAANSDDAVQNFKQVAKDLGTVNDLTTVISKAKTKGIKVILEIGIGSIKETHKWFSNAEAQLEEGFSDIVDFLPKKAENTQEFKYSAETKGYYAVDSKTKEVPLNWKSEQVMDQFMKVIRFWTDLGVAGFVFKDFEFLGDVERFEMMNAATLKELRKFYRAIKEINDNIIIVGKSHLLGLAYTNQFTEGPTKVFDYFMSEAISLIGTSQKHGNDKIGKFRAFTLANSIKKYVNDSSNILTFGSNLSGRINSRWGNHGQFSNESAKALGMVLMLTPASSSVYYGDEIGSLNIGLTHLDNFQDPTLASRKKELVVKSRLKEKDIMDAQVLQNSINSRSLMAWDDEKNGGFSVSEKTITPVSSTYKEINVKNQFADKDSVLSFFKELNRIVGSSSYAPIIAKGTFSISSLIPGVIKIVSKLDDKEVRIYVNLTDKVKKIMRAKAGRVVLTTHPHKSYEEMPNSLEAFEGIMISKHTDEAIKATQQIKLQEAKAQAADLKALEKAKEEAGRAKAAEAEAKAQAKQQALDEKAAAKAASKQALLDDEAAKEAAAQAKEAEKVATKQAKEAEKQAAVDEAARLKAQSEKEAEKTRSLELKAAERQALKDEKEARKAEKLAEKTRIIELKAAEKEAKAQAKFAEREEESKRRADAAATDELERESADLNNVKKEVVKDEQLSELDETKAAIKAEKETAKQLAKDAKKFDIMNEEVLESDRTTLKEEEIAPTTQIDIDEIDDFEAFLNGNKK